MFTLCSVHYFPRGIQLGVSRGIKADWRQIGKMGFTNLHKLKPHFHIIGLWKYGFFIFFSGEQIH